MIGRSKLSMRKVLLQINIIRKEQTIYQEKITRENWRKIIQQLLSMCYILKKNKKHVLSVFQNTIQRKASCFLMIQDKEKQHFLALVRLSVLFYSGWTISGQFTDRGASKIPKICHISCNDETWNRYTLPKEYPKNM